LSLFITFEGPEGSGKTTQIRLLAKWLRTQGYDVLATREPGGTPIGDRIRTILLDPIHTEMELTTEVLLFSAARAQIVGQVIRPHLARGGIVLCDRYADSTMAYQGYGHQLSPEAMDKLRLITAFATGGLVPQLTVYLDLSVEAGLRRKAGCEGEDAWNRMERKEIEYHRRVRAGYLEMAAAEPERWLVLDAAMSVDAIQHRIRERVRTLLERLSAFSGRLSGKLAAAER